MLSSLQIENVAVIQKANVHFEKGLNVLTGETGAGKSILIDSINAILGNRTSKDLVRTGAAKAVIRAAFEDVPPAVLDSLEKAGYERSEALLLSREITAEGKSTCRINGMPATAAVLRELCGGLININGQHDSVGLLNPARHEGILDAYAQNSAEYQAYYAIYRELVGVKKTLDAMITDESEKQRRIDLLSYQVQEIDDAGLTAGEEQTLESRRKVLANASTIGTVSHSVMRCSRATTRPRELLTFWAKPPTLWTQRHSSTESCLPVRASCSTFITPQRTSPQTSLAVWTPTTPTTQSWTRSSSASTLSISSGGSTATRWKTSLPLANGRGKNLR